VVRVVARRGRAGSERDDSGGFADGPGSAPCAPDTRFQAGSISKQVMSVVVLALTERGLLQLDRPIGTWLPHLPLAFRSVTLHQLLSHTSGIGHWGDVPGLAAVLAEPPERADLVEMILDTPTVRDPGESWRYSGPGFVVVALVIEAVTGRPYGEVAADIVFTRVGMRSTSSGRYPVGDADVAVGHRAGQPISVRRTFTDIPGTGDLWTTAGDLIRYARALRGGTLLTETAASRLWTPHAHLTPPAPGDDLAAVSYGYGTFRGRVLSRDAWFVPGDNPGYQSLLASFPATGADLVILSNQIDGVQVVLHHLRRPLPGTARRHRRRRR